MKSILSVFSILIILSLLSGSLSAAERKYDYKVKYEKTAPRLDGKLSDACWKDKNVLTGFTRVYHENSNWPHKTEMMALWTDKALYIGVKCYDENIAGIKHEIHERDGNTYSDDSIELCIDPDRNPETFVKIIINADGIFRDLVIGEGDSDPVVRNLNIATAGRIDKKNKYWCVELMIPFKDLKNTPMNGTEWGFNICRNRTPAKQCAVWNPEFRGYNNPAGKLIFERGK